MKKSAVDTEPIIKELVKVIFQIESQLKINQVAFNENHINGVEESGCGTSRS